jgi:hypothetical protein
MGCQTPLLAHNMSLLYYLPVLCFVFYRPIHSSLGCILGHWKQQFLASHERKALIHVYKCFLVSIQIGEWRNLAPKWKFKFNTILQLDLFCRRQGKWSEIPYIQILMELRDKPDVYQACANG